MAVADRKHAATNPKACFYEQADHARGAPASRWIVEPLHLLDCCQESDGGVALVVTSAPSGRATCSQPPAVIEAAAQGAGRDQEVMTSYYRDDITGLPEMGVVAPQVCGRSRGSAPTDIQTAILYDHFTPFVLTQLEEFGFCGGARPRTSCATARSSSAAGCRSTPTAASSARPTSTA